MNYKFFDASWTEIGTPYAASDFNSTYEERNTTFTAPAGAVKFQVWVWNSSGGDLFIDDISLIDTSTVGGSMGSNLAANPGFEGGNITPWSDWGSGLLTADNGGNAHTDTWAAKVGQGSGGGITVDIVAGIEYAFSVWGRTTGASGSKVNYKFFDASWAEIGTPYAASDFNGNYEERNATFTAPAGAVRFQVWVWNNSGGDLFLDDVSVAEMIPASGSGGGVETALLTNVTYRSDGAIVGWHWANDINNPYTRTFDLDGRLISFPIGHLAEGGITRTVTYDAASRITQYVDNDAQGQPISSRTQTFLYDDLNRLTQWNTASATRTYQYDLTGNRTASTIDASAYTLSIEATSNRLTATTGPTPAQANVYDAAGNLTTNGQATFAYSDRGRMASATVAGQTTSYTFNGLGQRVEKISTQITSGRRLFTYNEAGQLVGEYNASGESIQETVYLNGMPVSVLLADGSGGTTIHHAFADQINTVRGITRASDNKLAWRWDAAEPFGDSAPDEDPATLGAFTYNLRFPGQYADAETALSYNYFRDYDAGVGRYVQSDPIGLAGGVNTYVYAMLEPNTEVDRFGLHPTPGVGHSHIFEPKPTSRGNCGTAECAAGLLPAPIESRSTAEIDKSLKEFSCKLICRPIVGAAIAACTRSVTATFSSFVASQGAQRGACEMVCGR